MPKFTYKKKPLSYYRKKADKLIQEIGRLKYDSCLVCGGNQQVMHHYHSKAHSSALRYIWKNLVPLCNSCHYKLHLGYPEIQNTIERKNGQDWVDELLEEKNIISPINKGYYISLIEVLEEEKLKATKHEDF